MKKIKKIIAKNIIKFIFFLNNYLYKKLSQFSIIYEGGIHPKHRLMNFHSFFMDNIEQYEEVLDIGCGNGCLTFDLSKKAKKITGIDINTDNINFAKKYFNSENIIYINGDINNYFFDKKFDTVVLSNVLEHIEKRIELLGTIKSICKKILIRVPVLDRSWVVYFKKEMGVEYRLDETHYIEYTFDSFEHEIEQAGLKIIICKRYFDELWAVVGCNS